MLLGEQPSANKDVSWLWVGRPFFFAWHKECGSTTCINNAFETSVQCAKKMICALLFTFQWKQWEYTQISAWGGSVPCCEHAACTVDHRRPVLCQTTHFTSYMCCLWQERLIWKNTGSKSYFYQRGISTCRMSGRSIVNTKIRLHLCHQAFRNTPLFI